MTKQMMWHVIHLFLTQSNSMLAVLPHTGGNGTMHASECTGAAVKHPLDRAQSSELMDMNNLGMRGHAFHWVDEKS
jgi:hypothetical protein